MDKAKKKKLVDSLEHWAHMFRYGYVSDELADDIAYILEDKALEIRGELENGIDERGNYVEDCGCIEARVLDGGHYCGQLS